jgi:small subunit ribosomal protein S15
MTASDSVTANVSEDISSLASELTTMEPAALVQKFQRHSQDTGSPEVQIALVTQRLAVLAKHFATNPKDHHSRRGMLDLISQRKGLLSYLKSEDIGRYRNTLAALGLRK